MAFSEPMIYAEDLFVENTTYGINTTEINIPLLAQQHFFFKASQAVNNYYASFIIALGLVGNTISFFVMVQASMTSKIQVILMCKMLF